MSREQVDLCIDACTSSARECRAFCEQHRSDSRLLVCVINCRDCAELCEICVEGLKRGVRVAGALCRACAAACDLCVEAFRTGDANDFRSCIEACLHCATECRKLGDSIPSTPGAQNAPASADRR
jgi:hypothetical protein